MHYKKAFELAKKAGNNAMLLIAVVVDISECYIRTGRLVIAMHVYKRFCAEVGMETTRAVYGCIRYSSIC